MNNHTPGFALEFQPRCQCDALLSYVGKDGASGTHHSGWAGKIMKCFECSIQQRIHPVNPSNRGWTQRVHRENVTTPDETSAYAYATYEGLGYVVLRHVGGILAVYRVRSDNGMLRRIKRRPKGLDVGLIR